MANAESGQRPIARPLSPHLQIYSPLINMVMSILHRITGTALYFGTLIIVVWLVATASGASSYVYVMGWLKTPLFQVILAGYTWALIHHCIGGLRHLIWDTGHGFSLPSVNFLSWMTIVVSLVVTAAIWFLIFNLRGLL